MLSFITIVSKHTALLLAATPVVVVVGVMDVGCVYQPLDVHVVVWVVEVGGAVVPDGRLVDMVDMAAERVAGQ